MYTLTSGYIYLSQSGWGLYHLLLRLLISLKSLAETKASPTFFCLIRNHASCALIVPNHSGLGILTAATWGDRGEDIGKRS